MDQPYPLHRRAEDLKVTFCNFIDTLILELGPPSSFITTSTIQIIPIQEVVPLSATTIPIQEVVTPSTFFEVEPKVLVCFINYFINYYLIFNKVF